MKRISPIIFRMALIISLLLSGCAVAQPIQSVGFYSTLQGMISAAQGAPGSFIYSDGNNYLLAWQMGQQYGFVVLNSSGDPVNALATLIGNGQKVNAFTMSDLIKCISASGWRMILPQDLPAAFTDSLLSTAAASIASGSRALTSFIILPAGSLPQGPYNRINQ